MCIRDSDYRLIVQVPLNVHGQAIGCLVTTRTVLLQRFHDILNSAGHGDPRHANELLSAVYDELRHLAARKMASESPGQTLQPTALAHEAWLRLTNDANRKWNDRT